MMRSGSGYGSGCKRTLLTTVKMAVFAPMPRASAATATVVKPGFARSILAAYRRSATSVSMERLTKPNGVKLHFLARRYNRSMRIAALVFLAVGAFAQQRADVLYDEAKVPSYTLPDVLG